MNIILLITLILNTFLMLSMIFVESRKPSTVISWAVIMLCLPYVGFVLYLLVGGSLSWKTRRMLKRKAIGGKEFKKLVHKQKNLMENEQVILHGVEKRYSTLIKQNLLGNDAMFTTNNKIELFCDGQSKLKSLLKDLNEAKKSINMCYYILATDSTGMQVIKTLIKKANEGVEVNLLVDSVGSLRSARKEFEKLVMAGGKFAEFFPPFLGFRLFNFRVNYRNHRKIVVIDNSISYVGGINIRDDHMNKSKKLYPWVDMHLRIEGGSVIDLQKTFLKDWRYSYRNADFNTNYLNRFFEFNNKDVGSSGVQIVSSGPDENIQYIRNGMIKMITLARKSIVLVTPYFVPDETFMDSLKIALVSGVAVKIFIPALPDKKIVYYSSLSYLKELVSLGAKLYLKSGFLHSKCLIVDSEMVTIGSCNADVRSFQLNFETNAFIYDKQFTENVVKIIDKYTIDSVVADKLWFINLPKKIKARMSFWRLFSSIL